MFERLTNFFRPRADVQKETFSDENAADPSSKNYPNSKKERAGFYRAVTMNSGQNRIYEQLRGAMTMFTVGHREDTIPFFENILSNPAADATARTISACLLGETFRGMGNFGKAQQYYSLAIRESDTIPESMQALNEFIRHYRPRAFCGLLTVYRRTLFDDHEKIKSLIKEIKSDFSLFPIEDLPAQVSLMEGLYLRQLGNLSSSITCISEGLESVKVAASSTSYFLFLHPEHFEALLLISHLCSPGNSFHVRKISQEILKAGRGPWSLAFAAAAQLHLHLRRAANEEFTNFSSNEFGQESEKVSKLIADLQKNAGFENDPLLLTECAMLSLIWYLLIEDFQKARRELDVLKKMLPDCSQPLILLRSVELGALRWELELAGLMPDPELETVFDLGQKAFSELSKPLQKYGCSDELHQIWKGLLSAKQPGSGFLLELWTSEEVTELRSRVWP